MAISGGRTLFCKCVILLPSASTGGSAQHPEIIDAFFECYSLGLSSYLDSQTEPGDARSISYKNLPKGATLNKVETRAADPAGQCLILIDEQNAVHGESTGRQDR